MELILSAKDKSVTKCGYYLYSNDITHVREEMDVKKKEDIFCEIFKGDSAKISSHFLQKGYVIVFVTMKEAFNILQSRPEFVNICCQRMYVNQGENEHDFVPGIILRARNYRVLYYKKENTESLIDAELLYVKRVNVKEHENQIEIK